VGAAGFLLNDFRRVFITRVNGQIRAHRRGQFQLPVVDVNGDHFGVKDVFGILQRQVAEAAKAINGDPLAWFDVRDFHCFISCDARAGDA
jgi:hypothetical protein